MAISLLEGEDSHLRIKLLRFSWPENRANDK